MSEPPNGKGDGQDKKTMPFWFQLVVALIAALALLWWSLTYFFPDKTPTYETSFKAAETISLAPPRDPS